MFRSRFLMAAFVAAIAALAGPATSQAGFIINISDSFSSTSTGNIVVGGDDFTGVYTLGDLKIGIHTTSNSPGTNSDSEVASSTITVSSNAAGIHATTLTISVIADGFANAPNPVLATLQTSISASFLQGQPAFGHTGTGNGYSTINGSHIAGSDVTVGGVDATSVPGQLVSNPYTLGNVMSIGLAADSRGINGTEANVNITTLLDGGGNFRITPAPAGLILAASGLPFLGLLRRRLRRAGPTVAA